MKELRQQVARIGNQINRRKNWRKATRKERKMMEELKIKAGSNLYKMEELMTAKEISLEKLREKIIKLAKQEERDKRLRNNNIFQKDEESE